MARHVDVAAEMLLMRIERGDLPALFGRQQLLDDCAAIAAEVGSERWPVISADALLGHRIMGRREAGLYVHGQDPFEANVPARLNRMLSRAGVDRSSISAIRRATRKPSTRGERLRRGDGGLIGAVSDPAQQAMHDAVPVCEFRTSLEDDLEAAVLQRLTPALGPGVFPVVRFLRRERLPRRGQRLLARDQTVVVGLGMVGPDAQFLEVVDRTIVIGDEPLEGLNVEIPAVDAERLARYSGYSSTIAFAMLWTSSGSCSRRATRMG